MSIESNEGVIHPSSLIMLKVGTAAMLTVGGVAAHEVNLYLANESHDTRAVSTISNSASPSAIQKANEIAHDATTCNITPLASFAAADRMLAKADTATPLDYSPTAVQDIAVARTMGLTVFSNEKLHEDTDLGPISSRKGELYADPFSYYFSNAKNYLAKLGVKLEIGPDPKTAISSSRQPTKKQLETPAAKETVTQLFDAFYGVSKELIDATKLREIRLVSKTEGAAAYAITGGATRTIYSDVDASRSSETETHELTHLVDTSECGSPEKAGNDPEFTALNDVTDPYDQLHLDSYTGDYRNFLDARYNEFYNPETGELRPDKVCNLAAQIKKVGPEVVTFSDYHPNVPEDKAETEKNIFEPTQQSILLDKRFPILRAKFRLVVARLYTLAPKVAEYYMKIGQSYPHQSVLPPDC